jgi:hypothetical protein
MAFVRCEDAASIREMGICEVPICSAMWIGHVAKITASDWLAPVRGPVQPMRCFPARPLRRIPCRCDSLRSHADASPYGRSATRRLTGADGDWIVVAGREVAVRAGAVVRAGVARWWG